VAISSFDVTLLIMGVNATLPSPEFAAGACSLLIAATQIYDSFGSDCQRLHITGVDSTWHSLLQWRDKP